MIARIKSRDLSKALDSKKFFSLEVMVRKFTRDGDYFISKIKENKTELGLILGLYYAENPESLEVDSYLNHTMEFDEVTIIA